MTREEIMERIADFYGIEPSDNGEYDIDSYNWQAGCSLGRDGAWLCLASIVDLIEERFV